MSAVVDASVLIALTTDSGPEGPMATLDRRLTAASGPRCAFLLPPSGQQDQG